ncbi:MAG: hypothetical protein HUU57_02335 [Bdellovibrio sp.]|nr:hypothetical protein [Bdellovibrio sp.]
MKSLLLSLLSVITLAAPSAFAFVSAAEETLLLQTLNQASSAQVHFENIRCSARNSMCIFKLQLQPGERKAGCMIEGLNAAADLYVEENINGVARINLSAYATEALQQCLRSLR